MSGAGRKPFARPSSPPAYPTQGGAQIVAYRQCVTYSSFDEILRDRRISFGPCEPTPDAVLRTIEAQLKELVAQTVDQTSEEYRLLVEARQWLEEFMDQPPPRSTALVQLPAHTLEKIVDAISRDIRPPIAPLESVEQRMIEHTGSAVRRASEDFRRDRAWPIAGGGGLVATLLAAAKPLGVETAVGADFYFVISGAVLCLALSLVVRASLDQRKDEEVLRQLYDPDVHGRVVAHIFAESSPAPPNGELDYAFTRSEFRHVLWHEVTGLPGQPHPRPLSTVDLPGALVDATQLALERLVEIKVLKLGLREGVETFFPGGAL